MLPAATILYAACCIAYGYCLEYRVNIAGPLILQFVSEYPVRSGSWRKERIVLRSRTRSWICCNYCHDRNRYATYRPGTKPELFGDCMREPSISNSVVQRLTDSNNLQNNVVRCALGALYVATIDLTLQALGPGKTFVVFSMISIAFLPGIFIVIKIGKSWRARRAAAELKHSALKT